MVAAHQPMAPGCFLDVVTPLLFAPFKAIPRQTEAQWITAALDLAPPKNPPAFADESAISPGAQSAAAAAVAAGYLQALPRGFNPTGTMTRLAAAELIAQIIDNQAP